MALEPVPPPPQSRFFQEVVITVATGVRGQTADVFDTMNAADDPRPYRPEPIFRDPDTQEWWGLHTPNDMAFDGLGWTVDLRQLALQGGAAGDLLSQVVAEVSARAARMGMTLRPVDVPAALRAMQRLELENKTIGLYVSAPRAAEEWRQALESVGFGPGDGDMFHWFSDPGEGHLGALEIGCEPCTREGPAYFEAGDQEQGVVFSLVHMYFGYGGVDHPDRALLKLHELAVQVAAAVGGTVMDEDGAPYSLPKAQADVATTERQRQALLS